MPRRRSCDLTELVARVRAVSPGRSPVVVAVSGFAAAGKTTLAGLLAERLGADVVRVDDLLDADTGAAPLDVDLEPAILRAHTELLAPLLATGARDLVLDGRHLLHPALAELSDVRVWLDVDTVRAASNGFFRRVEDRRRRGVTEPLGVWSVMGSERPPPRTSQQRFLDAHRPDLTADALFVPVGRMVPPVELRFMEEACCDFVLWDDGTELAGELEDLLPMPEDLRARIKDWAHRSDQGHGAFGPDVSHRGYLAFRDEGRRLSEELQRTLGPDWAIHWIG